MSKPHTPDEPTQKPQVSDTGHEWDGITELNNPLPRWWLWTFWICVIFALTYSVLFPAWPLLRQATPGLLGYSTRGEVEEYILEMDSQNAELELRLAEADLLSVQEDPELYGYAINAGASVFRATCVQCHGAGAAGVQGKGYPNLLDDDWLWGGTIEEIAYTVTHGVRNQQSPDARFSEMPIFGEIMTRGEITQLANHVRAISGQEYDAELAALGSVLFYDNCAACHGDEGKGDRDFGAPNLTDAIWLYGGSYQDIVRTITGSRFGVMPAWAQEYRQGFGLSQADINAVALYVHQLGGGE